MPRKKAKLTRRERQAVSKLAFDEAWARAEPEIREVLKKKFGPLPHIPGAMVPKVPGSDSSIPGDLVEALCIGHLADQHRKLGQILERVEPKRLPPLAEKLRWLRTNAGWSQDDLVDAICKLPNQKQNKAMPSKRAVQYHERGAKPCSNRWLKRYADVYKITMAELLS